MNVKTQIELMRALRSRRKASQAGFTLVEVLVVAGILAILFASLVPNLLAARSRAAASAVISEAVGIARACQGVMASGTGQDLFVNPTNGANVTCSGVSPAQVTITSRTWNGNVTTTDNIRCLGTSPAVSSVAGTPESVVITIAADAQMSCT